MVAKLQETQSPRQDKSKGGTYQDSARKLISYRQRKKQREKGNKLHPREFQFFQWPCMDMSVGL